MDNPIITVDPWTPGQPVSVSGLGLTLRSMTPADVDETLLQRLRDPRVSAQLALGGDIASATQAAFVGALARFDNRHSFFLAIRPEGGGDLLGFGIARTDAHLVSVITMAVTDISQWRRNVTAAGGYLLRAFLFDKVKVHKLAARVFSTNPVVISGLLEYGWTQEGVLRGATLDDKDGRRDIVVFGLFRAEHLAAKMVKPYVPETRPT